jgi:SecD/SecF fusion protein
MRRLLLGVIMLGLAAASFLSCGHPFSAVQTPTSATGTELIYQVDLSQIGNESITAAIQGTIDTMIKRLDALGFVFAKATIQKLGSDEIIVNLPAAGDEQAAINLIGSTGQLEFKEMEYGSSGNPVLDSDGNPLWIPAMAVNASGLEVPLTGQYLKRNAKIVFAPNTNAPEVAFEFNSDGATLFSQITGRLIGKPLGIFLDDQLISSPTVQAQIGPSGVIPNLPLNEANNLVILLNTGALPVPLRLVSSRQSQ